MKVLLRIVFLLAVSIFLMASSFGFTIECNEVLDKYHPLHNETFTMQDGLKMKVSTFESSDCLLTETIVTKGNPKISDETSTTTQAAASISVSNNKIKFYYKVTYSNFVYPDDTPIITDGDGYSVSRGRILQVGDSIASGCQDPFFYDITLNNSTPVTLVEATLTDVGVFATRLLDGTLFLFGNPELRPHGESAEGEKSFEGTFLKLSNGKKILSILYFDSRAIVVLAEDGKLYSWVSNAQVEYAFPVHEWSEKVIPIEESPSKKISTINLFIYHFEGISSFDTKQNGGIGIRVFFNDESSEKWRFNTDYRFPFSPFNYETYFEWEKMK